MFEIVRTIQVKYLSALDVDQNVRWRNAYLAKEQSAFTLLFRGNNTVVTYFANILWLAVNINRDSGLLKNLHY